jgi:N-acetylglutamate synthase-like GNAT family acetyltransferase
MYSCMKNTHAIRIRNHIIPGDVEEITALHGKLYQNEYGFDTTFESYVATPLQAFAASHTKREKIWIVEYKKRIQGSLAIVKNNDTTAQLRWFLIHPRLRNRGIGTTLLTDAIQFTKENDYASVFLWTVSILDVANKMYTTAGFHLKEEKPHSIWGKDLVEQRYELVL